MSIIIRSIIFNVVFYIALVGFVLIFMPAFLIPRKWAVYVMKIWVHSFEFIYTNLTGTRIEIRGRENLIHGPCIVASKHQSIWETYATLYLLDDPAVILKRELNWIPVFGWWSMKFSMVTVNRGGRSKAIRSLVRSARQKIAENRQVLIFPEGTRRPPGAEPRYKQGVAALYTELGVPCVPIALNSGLYWPRRKFLRYPGTIIVEILPPIEPGLDRNVFFSLLQEQIEGASRRLIEEAALSDNPPPLAQKENIS